MLNAENYKEALLAAIKQLIESVPNLSKHWEEDPTFNSLSLPEKDGLFTTIVKSSRTKYRALLLSDKRFISNTELSCQVEMTVSQDLLTHFCLDISRNKYGKSGLSIEQHVDPHQLGWKKDLLSYFEKCLQ